VASPLDQFEIQTIVPILVGPFDISFTNSALWMGIAVACIYALIMVGSRHHAMVPGRLQSIVEMAYEFVAGLIQDNVGKEGLKYFPWIFTLFMFILFGNLLGMIPLPGVFTFTSHIIVTFTMAIFVMISVTVLGFVYHGPRFARFFVPEGAPTYMLPLLVPIEVISYCVRPVSLSVRLFVNMMAGHTMLKIFATFSVAMAGAGVIGFLGSLGPILIALFITGLELAIAFLQAYVFTVLTCLYLNDAIHMH
jgi:F-type H+-transporting ATPase subunit a